MLFQLTFDVELPGVEGVIPDFVVPLRVGKASVHLEPVGHDARYVWKCVAAVEHEPSEEVKRIFTSLNDGSLDPDKEWDDKFGRRGGELLGPRAYRAFVDTVQQALEDLAHRCVSLIQWRLDLCGSHQPLKGGNRLFWSLNGTDWKQVPCVSYSTASLTLIRGFSEPVHTQLMALLSDGNSQPLGHELLREAIQLRINGCERSAFVVAVMAAEVGVKQCIMNLAPQTEWLLRNLQSPPLHKLVEELLPSLVESSPGESPNVIPLPKFHCEVIRKAVLMRNDIVHKGHHEKVSEKLPEVISAVRDLLYRLDCLRGARWATQYLKGEQIEELPIKKQNKTS